MIDKIVKNLGDVIKDATLPIKGNPNIKAWRIAARTAKENELSK